MKDAIDLLDAVAWPLVFLVNTISMHLLGKRIDRQHDLIMRAGEVFVAIKARADAVTKQEDEDGEAH